MPPALRLQRRDQGDRLLDLTRRQAVDDGDRTDRGAPLDSQTLQAQRGAMKRRRYLQRRQVAIMHEAPFAVG
jgi:hypothetical protein